jgi:hypothetical protein
MASRHQSPSACRVRIEECRTWQASRIRSSIRGFGGDDSADVVLDPAKWSD